MSLKTKCPKPSADPAVKAARDRVAELEAKRDGLKARLAALDKEIAAHPGDEGRRKAAAVALVENKECDLPELGQLKEDRVVLSEALAVVAAAMKELQPGPLGEAEDAAERAAAAAYDTELKPLVLEVQAAAMSLRLAILKARDARGEAAAAIQAAGCSPRFLRGLPRIPQSEDPAWALMKFAENCGKWSAGPPA